MITQGPANTFHVFVCETSAEEWRQVTEKHPADVYNKVDAISLEQLDKLAREPHSVVISCEMELKYFGACRSLPVTRMLIPELA